MRPANTWVCVVDGGRAQFYRCDGPGHSLELMPSCMVAAAACRQWQDEALGRFACRVALQLERAAEDHLFEHLVLVAPHAMLGTLRRTLKDHSRELLVSEVEKDLTRATPRELSTHLGAMRH
jgi:protein required for attachment to host cells